VNERGEGRLIRCTDEGGKAIAIGWGHTHRFQPYNNAGGRYVTGIFRFFPFPEKPELQNETSEKARKDATRSAEAGNHPPEKAADYHKGSVSNGTGLRPFTSNAQIITH
jgi:hypothetical protein